MRFVILHHTGWPGRADHYDLMIQTAAGKDDDDRVLKTYSTLTDVFPDAPATLQVREMERILDFLQVKVIGKGPMTRASCIEYWGKDQDVCKDLPQ